MVHDFDSPESLRNRLVAASADYAEIKARDERDAGMNAAFRFQRQQAMGRIDRLLDKMLGYGTAVPVTVDERPTVEMEIPVINTDMDGA